MGGFFGVAGLEADFFGAGGKSALGDSGDDSVDVLGPGVFGGQDSHIS